MFRNDDFYSYSQDNVPNGIDRFQRFAFAGLHLLIKGKAGLTDMDSNALKGGVPQG
jgi:hypothetical protein